MPKPDQVVAESMFQHDLRSLVMKMWEMQYRLANLFVEMQ